MCGGGGGGGLRACVRASVCLSVCLSSVIYYFNFVLDCFPHDFFFFFSSRSLAEVRQDFLGRSCIEKATFF